MNRLLHSGFGLAFALILTTCLAVGLKSVALAAGVVGTGTPESCTEAAFDAALVGGGQVTFNCGIHPMTITIGSGATISADTTVDGSGLITLAIAEGVNERLFSVNPDATLRLQRLTLAGRNTPQWSPAEGAGIYNTGTLLIDESLLRDSLNLCGGIGCAGGVGGAIYNTHLLTITNSRFEGNSAVVGGAIYNSETGQATIQNSAFVDNLANNGNGAAIDNRGRLAVAYTQFEGNRAECDHRCLYSYGGAIFNGDLGEAEISHSTFYSNTGIIGGGFANNGRAKILSSLFRNNVAFKVSNFATNVGQGGAIGNRGKLRLEDVSIIGNRSGEQGGGIFQGQVSGERLEAFNLLVADNRVDGWGGPSLAPCGSGLFLNGNAKLENLVVRQNRASTPTSAHPGSCVEHDGAVYLTGGTFDIQHATLVSNSHAAIWVDTAALTLTNAIVVSHTMGISSTANISTHVTVNGVLWKANAGNTNGSASISIQNAHTGDPAFAADGYHLSSASAAIDAGVISTVNKDIDGDTRPLGQASDLGVDEYNGEAMPSLPRHISVISAFSGECLDVAGAENADGAAVIQWSCAGNANQVWQVQADGAGYRLRAAHSSKCLDVAGASQVDGAAAIQRTCQANANQLWMLQPLGKQYRLVAAHSDKCLTIPIHGKQGIKFEQQTCIGTANQRFILQSAWNSLYLPLIGALAQDK